jgi:hypothetical protein
MLKKSISLTDNGMGFKTCILLEPSQQYKGDFLEEIVFQGQLRNELEEMERSNQIQLTVNADVAIEKIIKKAKKNKKQSFNQPTSKKAKIAFIRDNKDVEKQLNRERRAVQSTSSLFLSVNVYFYERFKK